MSPIIDKAKKKFFLDQGHFTSFCGHFTYTQKHYESCEMKHERTQWKCFVPDTPSFCDHIWSHVELVSETFHIESKMTLVYLKVPYYSALTLSSLSEIILRKNDLKFSSSVLKHFPIDFALERVLK